MWLRRVRELINKLTAFKMTFHLMEIMILKEVDRISIETEVSYVRDSFARKMKVDIAFFCCRRNTDILSISCFARY